MTFKRGKTPGSDDLPVELYVEVWDLIGPDLLDFYEETVGKGSMPQSLREGMITLLCKQKGEKEKLKNWRPISLLNVDYKILAKAMANRLKKVIAKTVHPDQTCGIPGRQIADSLALVWDTIECVKSQKVQAALVSLEQEKAFDHVSHDFMDWTLRALGDFFCDVVTTMYRDTSSTALVNGWKPYPIPSCQVLGEDLYRFWKGIRSKDQQRQVRNPTPRPLDPHPRPTAIPHQVGFHENPWSLVRRRRCCGEVMGRKAGEDKGDAGTLEPSEADDQREVFGPMERDPASALVCCSSVASAALNGQGHHKIDLLLHLELQDGYSEEKVMFKTHDKGGKGVPDIATILRGTFVCHCLQNSLRTEDESHVGFLMT
ncbi:hypothetical protein NDU88_007919 [Pleurodeles waltl]|uniref:Reverse transcriptase domain-containing protein n=1 Tax=Pleurodeles waltl TaxID=8319 RepID=A0AAV7PQ90_PLEWA|nr:hypothetical protein NDU88_007919 [Pleurodeles waltl]